MMKKLSALAILVLATGLLSGCAEEEVQDVTPEQCAAYGGTMTERGCEKSLTAEECDALGGTMKDGDCVTSEVYYEQD
ncbi:MAG: hypothetical protein AAGJ52_06845 [Pseudomonadota bacterium]